jgi:hypothetical protein
MRRLCVILLCGLVAVPAAMAASRATGDGVLEVFNAYGVVTVNGTRGTAWGQIGKGQLIVTDYVAGDGQVLVSGADTTPINVSSNVTIYSGKDIHFRVTGGRYKLRFTGNDINLSAVGVGTAKLTGDDTAGDPGDYALDGGKRVPMPLLQRLVSFPNTPVTTP